MRKPDLQDPQTLQLIEIVTEKLDTAWMLQGQLVSRGQAARDYLEREGFVNTFGDWGLVVGVVLGRV